MDSIAQKKRKRHSMVSTSSGSADILHLPLEQLALVSMRRLREHRVLERAAQSTLYFEKWRAAGIRVEDIETEEDFSRIPLITSQDLRKAINEDPLEKVLCSNTVLHWFSTTGTTGMPKWIPYGRRDLELYMEIRDRCSSLFASREGLKGFAVSAVAPFVEAALAAFEKIRVMQTGKHVEGLIISFTEAENDPVNFALDLKPNFIAAFPGFAARFAEIIEEKAPQIARQKFREEKSLGNLVAYLVTRVKKIRPKNLSGFRFGLFGGEPLAPYREALKRTFGFEPIEMYNLTESIYPAIECHMHDGMHLWMDVCLPEIIPQEELDREIGSNAYTPRAIPLWRAGQGLKGEYVLTTFGEVLPLIRYRTGDLIKVVSTERCRCGITHPRIKVPRRSDATICLGAVRFPAAELNKKLLAKTIHGEAQRWQLRIEREGYRPKPIIRLEPRGEISDRDLFLQEISKRLMDLEILRAGIENKLVVEPVILLEKKIPVEGRVVTEAGRVIYGGENGEHY